MQLCLILYFSNSPSYLPLSAMNSNCLTSVCVCPSLPVAAQDHPDYRLQIVGHSLGAGTAALLSVLMKPGMFSHSSIVSMNTHDPLVLHESSALSSLRLCSVSLPLILKRLSSPALIEYPTLRCVAYACPLIVDLPFAKQLKPFITTIVFNHDVVAHMSIHTGERTRITCFKHV